MEKFRTYSCGNVPLAGDLISFGSRKVRMLVTRVDEDGPEFMLYAGNGEYGAGYLSSMRLLTRHGVPVAKEEEDRYAKSCKSGDRYTNVETGEEYELSFYNGYPKWNKLKTNRDGVYSSTGRISVRYGSVLVHGFGTAWKNAGVRAGDVIYVGRSVVGYVIRHVDTNATLVLEVPYDGQDANEEDYHIRYAA